MTCQAFLKHSWLGPCSTEFLSSDPDLESRNYRLSHYFPELAPICRMSGLMGSDVKIYHNLQFPRPLPPVMMLLAPASSLSLVTNRMNEWAAPSGGEERRGEGGVYLRPGAIMVIWSSELASPSPDPAINISLEQSFVTALNQCRRRLRCSWRNLPSTTCLMLHVQYVHVNLLDHV